MSLISLFWTFFYIGLFTIGGGQVAITLMQQSLVEKGIISPEKFFNMVAISESTPGPIAINAATYIGYKHLKVSGAVMATVGICLPSFVIIYFISLFFDAFLSIKLVEYAFRGIQVCVIYLVLSAGIKMLKQIKKTPLSITVISAVLLCMVIFSALAISFSTIFYIIISGCVALAVYFLTRLNKRKEEIK